MRRYKHGVTLLETVIALFLLTVITGGAFALCSSSASAVSQSSTKFAAVQTCDDVVECYKATDNKAQFELLLRACGYDFNYGTNTVSGEDGQQTTTENTNKLTLKTFADGYFVYVMLDDGATEAINDLQGVTLTVEAKSLVGKTLYTATYTKGGGHA